MTSDLRDILAGTEPAPVETPAEPVAEEVADEEMGEEMQDVVPDTEPEPEPVKAEVTPTPEPKQETAPVSALIAERRKRQELEARLRELEQAQPKPDFYADPEKYIDSRLSERTLQMSAAMVEAQHPDFKEKLAVFLEAAADNPLLQAEIERHPHPALYAYQQAQRIEEFRQLKDVDGMKAKLRAEIEAQVRAEYEAKQAQRQAQKASLPPDLTNARATRTPEPAVNASLESILKRNK